MSNPNYTEEQMKAEQKEVDYKKRSEKSQDQTPKPPFTPGPGAPKPS